MRQTRPVVAVVPLRDGFSGKSRLAAALDDQTRHRLVIVLAERVLGVLVAAPSVDRVVVVTADPGFVADLVGEISTELALTPLTILAQPADQPGLNAALEVAREQVRKDSPSARLLVVHADLPALSVADVEAVLASRSAVVLAGDRTGSGTNALVVDATASFEFRFGPGSLAAHRAQASAHGLDLTVVDRPGTRVDLDTTADWEHLPTRVRHAVGRRVRRPQ